MQIAAAMPVFLARPPDEALTIAPTPDGEHVVLTVGHDSLGHHPRTLYRMDANGGNLVNLTPGIRTYAEPAVSPDSRHVAYVVSDRGSQVTDLHVMDVDGQHDTNITPQHSWYRDPQWSADGKQLLVTNYARPQGEITLLSADGHEARVVRPLGAEAVYQARFSPDGSRIVFMANHNDRLGVSSVKLDGSDLRDHTAGLDVDDAYALTADGRILVTGMPDSDTRAIYSLSIDKPGPPVRLEHSGWAWMPIASPDGSHLSWLVGTSPDHAQLGLVVADAQGRQPRIVAPCYADTAPAYMPDGKSIVFEGADTPDGGISGLYRVSL